MLFSPASPARLEALFEAALLIPGGNVIHGEGLPVFKTREAAQASAGSGEIVYGVQADLSADTYADDIAGLRLARAVEFIRLPGGKARLMYRMMAHESEGGGPEGWMHWCMGCCAPHGIWIERPNAIGVRWVFDNNEASPTFSPSILIHALEQRPRCHYFIRAGLQQFCHDCGHPMAGKTLPLVLW